MKWLHWCFPVVSASAGLVAGRWLSLQNGLTQVVDETGAFLRRSVAVVSGLPSGVDIAAEEEIRRLWLGDDEAGTLAALVRLGQRNPARAFELALSLQGGDTGALLVKLAEKLPGTGKALLEVLLYHPEHHRSGGIADIAFRLCARDDPERAWSVAMSQPGKFVPSMLTAIANGLAERDPRLAMDFAARVQSPSFRADFVRDVISKWSDVDGKGLMAWLRDAPDRDELMKHVKWGHMRLASSADLAEMGNMMPKEIIEAQDDFRLFSGQAEDAWVTRTDWLLSLPSGEMREKLCSFAVRSLVRTDPEAALKLLQDVKHPILRALVTSAVAGFRAAESPLDGLAFANALTDDEQRRKARNAVYFTWAESDPPGAARYALESGDPEAQIMLNSAGTYWAITDAESACRFALEHDVTTELKLLASSVGVWAGRDPVGAALWVDTLPQGAQRDRAAAALATHVVYHFPEEAMIWAQNVADADRRRQTLGSCFGSWLYKDPTACGAWLESAVLDEVTKNALRSQLERRLKTPSTGSTTSVSEGIFIIN
jgi:hypothetical protein